MIDAGESRFDEPHLIYESGPILVVNKPGGLLTQAPPGIDSLEARLRRWILHRENRTGNIYLAVLHRLDRGVSGAIVFARHVRAASRLARQFENRSVTKTYWALVAGRPESPEGRWVDFMRKVDDQARSEIVSPDHPDAKYAALEYRTLASAEGVSLLEIQLETGRTHQIRLQAAQRNLPIVGDAQYGSQIPFGPQTPDIRLRAIALLSRRLKFRHPMTDETVDVIAPVPDYWPSGLFAAP
jgi:23S rRNA pseudouridine1911/1915/1917 synthase